jgi:hypothetical protein
MFKLQNLTNDRIWLVATSLSFSNIRLQYVLNNDHINYFQANSNLAACGDGLSDETYRRPWEVMDLGAANFDYDWLNDTLYNTNSTRASRGRKFQNEAPIAYKTKTKNAPRGCGQAPSHAEFLHSAVFTHRFLLQEETFTQKSVFTDTQSCSTLISCERVVPGASKFQFYLSF